ncbi:Dynein intermediate chain 3, axonemal [Geodia barretti]|nr:Dynein intermediate chain 3, axonemal [Geodia barretti]
MDIFITDVKLDHSPIVPPLVLSYLEHSHSLSVSHLHWIPDHNEICVKSTHVLENVSQFSHQLVTCGIDGYVMMWDTRPQQSGKKPTSPHKTTTPPSLTDLDLTWKPFYKIPLPRSELPKTFSATRVSLRERQRGRRGRQGRGEVGDVENQQVEKGSANIHPIVSQTDAGTGPEIEGASTKYFVGTEDGEIVWGDWTPSKDQESGKFIPTRPDYFSYGHCGSVVCMERSPFFRDILLTAGGWTWAIWREGEKNGPLLSSCSCAVQYTCGTWSPSRPGVFFLCQQNGGLEVWDLMDRSHEPTLSQNISSLPITSINPFRITSKQEMLAVGDSAGTLHILDVPWALKNPSTNEDGIMEAFFERETQRVGFSSGRTAARAAAKRESMTAASAELTKEESAPEGELEPVWQEEARREYEDYLATENKLLIELGLVEPLPQDND